MLIRGFQNELRLVSEDRKRAKGRWIRSGKRTTSGYRAAERLESARADRKEEECAPRKREGGRGEPKIVVIGAYLGGGPGDAGKRHWGKD